MTSYFRQGDIGCTTLLRMLYAGVVYVVLGGFLGLVFAVIYLESVGEADVREIVEMLGTASVSTPMLALSFYHIGALTGLGVAVRTFHRRPLRSVIFGDAVRYRRWLSALTRAAAVVIGGMSGAWLIGHLDLGALWGGPSTVVALLGVLVQAVSVESIRGYLLQNVAARCSAWRVRGVALGPWLAVLAALLPTGFALLVALGDSDLEIPFVSTYIALYVVGCGLLPALLLIVDEGMERAVGVSAAVRVGVLVGGTGGLAYPEAWAAVAAVAGLAFGGVVIWRRSDLWDRMHDLFARPTGSPDAESPLNPECSNCGTPLLGPYCHNCGQRLRTAEPSIQLLVQRVFDDVFEVDSRIMRSLRLLFLRPGALSAHYFAGRRADFIPPLRLYLVSSFAFFLLLAAVIPDDMEGSETTTAQLQVPRTAVDSVIAGNLAADSLVYRARYDGDAAMDSLPTSANGISVSRDAFDVGYLAGRVPDSLEDRLDIEAVWGDSLVVVVVEDVPVSPMREVPGEVGADVSEPEEEAGNAGTSDSDEVDPQQTLVENAARVMFLLVPAFAILLSLVYLHEPYAHHVIFTLHVHAFAFAVLSGEFLLETLSSNQSLLIGARITLGVLVFAYLVAALRRAYGGSWLGAFGRAFLIANLYFIVGVLIFGLAVGLLQNTRDLLPAVFL